MSLQPARRHYLAMFLISLALLMYEIAVARVLSVALFSHYAFVAVSLAMFGLGLAALVVYLAPSRFPADRLDRQVVSYAASYGAAAVASMVAFLRLAVVQELSVAGFLSLGLTYTLLAVPFFLGGLVVSLLMTHLSARIDRIYFADLFGASVGCLLVVLVLQRIPAPEVSLVVGFLASTTALVVAWWSAERRRVGPPLALAFVAVVAGLNPVTGLFTMNHVKGWSFRYSEFERWNAFSRVSVIPWSQNAAQTLPLKDGTEAYDDPALPETKMLDIDGTAWTPMFRFDGDLSRVGFLRESVVYAVHALRPGGNVLVIGTGGGRDLLAAKVFGQSSVVGIELNPLMREVVQERYGEYSGRPYTLDGVRVIIAEARSRLRTLARRFDSIQLSFIDTFALNAAGSFVFSENYLYTTEAFREFFRLLEPDGVLSVTRYFMPSYPLEVLKAAAMVRVAWEAEGIRNVGEQVVVLQQGWTATLLAKRGAFAPHEIDRLVALAAQNHMTVVYAPGRGGGGEIGEVLTAGDLRGTLDRFPFLIDPPTDDRPFFFSFLRGRLAADALPERSADPLQFMRQWQEALLLLYLLLAVVTALAVLFFLGPLLLLGRRPAGRVGAAVALPFLLYFACLGYGFMMIEIPLLQRFMLLLGYPVYALAVVLAALLLFSGIGSLLCLRLGATPERFLMRSLTAIVVVATIYVYALPPAIDRLLGAPILLRIAASVALLAPLGLLLGTAYPLGITILRSFDEGLVPWAWALNSALSVAASVGAIFLGSRIGFTGAFLTGVAAYLVALVAMAFASAQGRRARLPAS